MLSSIQESFEKQTREQGRPIRSSEDKYYLSSIKWKDSVEGILFWRILYYSYALYSVYDYETLIKLYIRFNTLSNNKNIGIIDIYYYYFDKEKGTLTDKGFENLIKNIENAE